MPPFFETAVYFLQELAEKMPYINPVPFEGAANPSFKGLPISRSSHVKYVPRPVSLQAILWALGLPSRTAQTSGKWPGADVAPGSAEPFEVMQGPSM